ncbi:MAG: hypothetical protein WBA17_08445 [Saprospiraceae bacterium]
MNLAKPTLLKITEIIQHRVFDYDPQDSKTNENKNFSIGYPGTPLETGQYGLTTARVEIISGELAGIEKLKWINRETFFIYITEVISSTLTEAVVILDTRSFYMISYLEAVEYDIQLGGIYLSLDHYSHEEFQSDLLHKELLELLIDHSDLTEKDHLKKLIRPTSYFVNHEKVKKQVFAGQKKLRLTYLLEEDKVAGTIIISDNDATVSALKFNFPRPIRENVMADCVKKVIDEQPAGETNGFHTIHFRGIDSYQLPSGANALIEMSSLDIDNDEYDDVLSTWQTLMNEYYFIRIYDELEIKSGGYAREVQNCIGVELERRGDYGREISFEAVVSWKLLLQISEEVFYRYAAIDHPPDGEFYLVYQENDPDQIMVNCQYS